MESLINSVPYSSFRRFFSRYQIIASVLVCLPVFLSLFVLIGVPHLFFVILTALLDGGAPGLARRILHGFMFLYYAALLMVTLTSWHGIIGDWNHADSVDKLIQVQMMLLPLILTFQLGMIAFEWIYPILRPHEILEQKTARQHKKSKIQSI